jgi:sugar lactone lactonase YvrE
MVAAAGGCAVVVAGALVATNLHNGGQRVAIRPAGPSLGPVPGTMFVANLGPTNNAGQYAGPGSVTLYPPGTSGNAHPEAVVTRGIDVPQAIAFDSSGDLWVANSGSSTVVEYDRAMLATASPAPAVTISGGAQQNLDAPYGLAFDRAGNLWVSNNASGYLAEFAKADLAKSGAPPPEVKLLIQGNPAVDGIVFDSSGDLWFGDAGFIDELSKGQLAKSGVVYPKLSVGTHGTISELGGKNPTFDRAGDLWNGADQNNIVGEYTKAQLAEWGRGTHPVSVDQPWKVVIFSAALSSPEAVASDRSANLWVPSQGNNKVVEFTKAELTKSGAPAPARTISGPETGLNNCYAVAFEP